MSEQGAGSATGPRVRLNQNRTDRSLLGCVRRRATDACTAIQQRGPGLKVEAFDDLPPADKKNVNSERPFGGKPGGGTPALSKGEINDVIAFLKTLTDADLMKK